MDGMERGAGEVFVLRTRRCGATVVGVCDDVGLTCCWFGALRERAEEGDTWLGCIWSDVEVGGGLYVGEDN